MAKFEQSDMGDFIPIEEVKDIRKADIPMGFYRKRGQEIWSTMDIDVSRGFDMLDFAEDVSAGEYTVLYLKEIDSFIDGLLEDLESYQGTDLEYDIDIDSIIVDWKKLAKKYPDAVILIFDDLDPKEGYKLFSAERFTTYFNDTDNRIEYQIGDLQE